MTEQIEKRLARGVATVAQLSGFHEIIDVRSPTEFEDDHLPGALSCPVLDDAQRTRIGTLYKQSSAFEARRLGAALVAQNIAAHLLQRFQDRGPQWRPLIYCWRGGQRSGAMVTVFRQIGWDAHQLEGGYRLYRRDVLARLEALPGTLELRVLGGPTGCAKSRVLDALAARGEQVLDLEGLACHKGSVLGALPGQTQPSQKLFETGLAEALRRFDPARPVYVEAESRRIGRLTLPTALVQRLRSAHCLLIEADLSARTHYLLHDYRYLIDDPDWTIARLQHLRAVRGEAQVRQWIQHVHDKDWAALVGSLLRDHYDPLYRRSLHGHFNQAGQARTFLAERLDAPTLATLAERIAALR